jgi:hypothetical protein
VPTPEAIMHVVLRRVRGAIGIGLTWAFAWSAAGAVPRWVFGVETDAPLPILFGVVGLMAGVVFSLVLALSARRRSFEQMSLPRFAGWGAVGGVLVSALFARLASLGLGDALALAPVLAAASAACAAGSLAVAKRAERRALPGYEENIADARLIEGDER